MPSPWNDATDRQLLLTIIHLTAPALPKWEKVAEMMGDGFTAESTRQHFQKIRKEAKAHFGEPGSVTPGVARKGTPRKAAGSDAAGGTPTKSTGKRKSKKTTDVNEEDDDENESPTKKVKAEEAQDDSDNDFA